jgi:hypothetical protein
VDGGLRGHPASKGAAHGVEAQEWWVTRGALGPVLLSHGWWREGDTGGREGREASRAAPERVKGGILEAVLGGGKRVRSEHCAWRPMLRRGCEAATTCGLFVAPTNRRPSLASAPATPSICEGGGGGEGWG